MNIGLSKFLIYFYNYIDGYTFPAFEVSDLLDTIESRWECGWQIKHVVWVWQKKYTYCVKFFIHFSGGLRVLIGNIFSTHVVAVLLIL